MSKHTPGPWVFEFRSGDHPFSDRNGWGCGGLWSKNGGFILGDGMGWESSYEGPNDANARLIAAAPDLLEALQSAVAYLEPRLIDMPQSKGAALLPSLKVAIAKATGND